MEKIPYQLIRSARKTLSIQLQPGGAVIVRAPSRMKTREVDRFVESKREWIASHQARLEPSLPKLTHPELETLARRAREVIGELTAYYGPLVGVNYGRITIRAQHTRWGSCTASGNLNFNCLLMLTPDDVIDYVVVHELCHRKQMNHSAAFWVEVERVLPDYRKSRQWLKDNGSALIGRLP